MRNVVVRLGLMFVLLISSLPLLSQDLFFEKITGGSNAPNTSIYGIAKDSVGFVWFGSWYGLYRYNGVSFEVFMHDEEDPYSLPNNSMRNVITDEDKQLWMLTFDNKYVTYNYALNRFNLVVDDSVPNNAKRLLRSNPTQLNRLKEIDGWRYFIEGDMFTSHNKKTGDTVHYKPNMHQPGQLNQDFITSFYIDEQNIVWVGSRNGTIYKANTFRNPFQLHHVYPTKGVNTLQAPVRTLLKKENQLWLGTNEKELIISDNEQVVEEHPYFKSGYNHQRIRALLEDQSGKVWIGSVYGLECYDPKTETAHLVFSKGLRGDQLVHLNYTLTQAHDNTIWAGVYNGIVKINPETYEVTPYDLNNFVGKRIIMSLVEDKQGDIWFATEGKGIFRLKFDANGAITDTLSIRNLRLKKFPGLSGNFVYYLYVDNDGLIWIATSEGLSCLDPTTLKAVELTEEDGLLDNYITAITSDANGDIWVSNKKGISRIQKGSFNISNYNIVENNTNWVFLDGACYNDKEQNTIYFGAREGYVSFNPDKIKSDPFSPQLLLTSFYINGILVKPQERINGKVIMPKALYLSESVELDYNNRNFSIDMTALHFQNPTGITYWYKLEGYDDDWIQTSHNRVTYNKIPAGNYRFIARAVSLDNTRSAKVDLQVTILSPWYATTWAIVAYVIILVLLLVFIYKEILSRERLKNEVHLERLNVEKQEELNREKLEFFTNVSHELRTPLTLIVDPIKQLQNKQLSADNRSLYLSIINKNVEQLSKLITQLLDFRKAESGKLKAKLSIEDAAAIIKGCVESFYMNARQRDIDLSFHSDVSQVVGYFDKNKVEQIFLNIVSNAFKYTQNGGEVSVDLGVDEVAQTIVAKVIDNGIGIETNSLKKIFEPFNTIGAKPYHGGTSGIGLALTRNLVEVLNGKITINSTYQQGTIVTVTLPFSAVGKAVLEQAKMEEMPVPNGHKSDNKLDVSVEQGTESKPVVLVVEDNKDVQRYLNAELSADYIVYLEDNGLAGLNRAISTIPDLIISDVMMPEMDGVTLCQEIKKNEKTCHVPLVLLTAKTTEANQIEGLKTGADAYIPKPFSVDLLKAQISSLLENRKRMQNALSQKEYINDLKSSESDINNVFLQKAVDVIQNNINQTSLNPEKLAELLQLSQRQLYRKIKAVSGSPVQEFITRVRMDEGARLLRSSTLNISQVAYEVGYSEPSNFSRTFNKHFGCTPTKYARQNR